MQDVRQNNFGAGEIAPYLYGRENIPQYGAGLRRCRNFFISQHGAAVSRPGTTFCGISGDGHGVTKLVPFIFSATVAYVLEFYPSTAGGFLKVWRNDGTAVIDDTTHVQVQIATPYGSGYDMQQARWAQSGNVLYLTHPQVTPQVVTRVTDGTWTIAALSFDLKPYTGYRWKVQTYDTAGGAGEPTQRWFYQATNVYERRDGSYFETAPYTVADGIGNDIAIYQDRKVVLVNDVFWAGDPSGYETKTTVVADGQNCNFAQANIYRGRHGFMGQVGYVRAGLSDARFFDYGDLPDYANPPPQGRNPFKILDTDGTTVLRTEIPQSVGFFDGRLVFGGTSYRPGWMWLSVKNDFTNFDRKIQFIVAPDAIEFVLATYTWVEIRAVLGKDVLLAFTSMGIWAIGGEAAISAAGPISSRLQSDIGCSWLAPLSFDDAVIYARAKGAGVREVYFSNEKRSFTGGDVSYFSQHLFDGNTLRSWAYAADPWRQVWAVRSDGRLLTLCYAPDQQMAAWTWHDSDDGLGNANSLGTFEDVCVVPGTSEDQIFFVVNRDGDKFLEKMATRQPATAKDAICLDCCTVYDGAATKAISGLPQLANRTVYAVADGAVMGPYMVSAGGTITIDVAATHVVVGLKYTPELELLDMAQERTKRKVIKRMVWDVYASKGLYTGPDFSHLDQWAQRDVSDAFNPVGLTTGRARVSITSGYTREGRAVLRQVDPFPVTVVGVTREVEIGGE